MKKSGVFRIKAALLAGMFFLNSILPAGAQTLSGKAPADMAVSNADLIKHIQVSEKTAFTEERYVGKGHEALWIIRDAHAIPDAQSSSGKIGRAHV